MSVEKLHILEAVNGSTVMLPCKYSSCIGIKDLYFNWQFNNQGTVEKVSLRVTLTSNQPCASLTACWCFQICESVIQSEGVVPVVKIFRQRVEFVGNNVKNNISILLWNITFEDGGQYTCFGINPKEKYKNHSATIELIVVDECEWSSPERSNMP